VLTIKQTTIIVMVVVQCRNSLSLTAYTS